MPASVLEINGKKTQLMKPKTGAEYGSKTVLTDSSWEYVELWLKRQKGARAEEALFYWNQAQHFYRASECLPIESRPLTSYYCCLNAAKALLAVCGPKDLDLAGIRHGIFSDRTHWSNLNITSAKVVFQAKGVLNELSKYFGESINKTTYSVYDLLYNIPCVHRAFSITFSVAELFIPIKCTEFVVNPDIKEGWFQFQIDERYANPNILKSIPSGYEHISIITDKCVFRRKKRFSWDKHTSLGLRISELSKYHRDIRKKVQFIFGEAKLWYIKKQGVGKTHAIDRNQIILIYAVMHWLSELVRYNPAKFAAIMKTKQNWLLREFIDNALEQFVDEVACEITKVDIMTRGYRK